MNWGEWRAARPPTEVLHLDSAAFGRSSLATLSATSQHALAESELGGYVAEEQAEPRLAVLRRDVAGLLGTDEEGVAFVENATAGFEVLLAVWPLPEGARVGVAAAEWGPNLELLERRGWAVELLPVDGAGVLALDELEARLAGDPPDLVLVDEVAAHRGLVQPAEEVVALGRAHGVPVWLDAAQAVGHVRIPVGADAVVATSRKWLTGPVGVGMLAVGEPHRPFLRVRRPAKHPDWPAVRLLESEEHTSRDGWGSVSRCRSTSRSVLRSWPRASPRWAVSSARRSGMLAGWEVVQPEAPAGSTTALVPVAGQDVVRARARLLEEHNILTSVCLPWRAPREMTDGAGPMLRLSPHVDLTADDLERLCKALSAV